MKKNQHSKNIQNQEVRLIVLLNPFAKGVNLTGANSAGVKLVGEALMEEATQMEAQVNHLLSVQILMVT